MKTMVVLGMHRSATSLVAKALDTQIYMGSDLMPANRGNPEGYYECLRVVALNDKILRAAGGSWHNPPPREKIQAQARQFDAEIAKLVQSHYKLSEQEGQAISGFKDPRMVLTAWLWHKHLQQPHYVSVWRNSSDIAESLLKRDRMPIKKGIELAEHYKQEARAFLRTI